MTKQEIIELFKVKPYYKRIGKGALAKKFRCSEDDILEAKKSAYKHKIIKKLPKILLLDIETSPLIGYIWKLWKENVSLCQIEQDWFCLCWSAKWLFSSKIMSDRLTSEEAINEDDGRIMRSLFDLLNEADVVIGHNSDKFDLPKINTRLLLNNISPPKPYLSIDTYKVVKTKFGFASNKLDWLATKLGFPNKISTTFDLWKGCVKGCDESLKQMEIYNRYDVELLESVYLKIRPWIQNHPNMALYLETNETVCPNCGSTHLEEKGFYYTTTNKYQLYKCECGAFSRMRKNSTPKDISKKILNNNLR